MVAIGACSSSLDPRRSRAVVRSRPNDTFDVAPPQPLKQSFKPGASPGLPMASTISLLCGVCLLGFSLIQLLFTVLS